MQDKTLRETHVQDLKFLQDYIRKIDSSLSGLSHTIGADLHGLGSSLTKTPGNHKSRYLPKPPRVPASSNFFGDLLGISGSSRSSSSNTKPYQVSTSQIWAGIASGIRSAIRRSL